MAVIHKTRTGRVLSNKMNKTIIVGIETVKKHRLYNKNVRRIVRYKAHDEKGECKTGDTVKIVETRPISKDKHWRVASVVNKVEQVTIQPKEVT
jgi:small subunit ribosomal protein S17